MKVVLHSSRGYSNTQNFGTLHNDRNYNCEVTNINPSKTANNIVWLYQDNLSQESTINTIEDCERAFYIDNFSDWLKLKNDRYSKYGHKERMMTMDKLRTCLRYCPEELIFQIGAMGDAPSLEEFTFISYAFIEYLQRWSKNHSNAFTILNWALHQDEIGCPHLHIRRVWHYIDEKSGFLQIGQEKTLEKIGYIPPYPLEKSSKSNNRKITYDRETRSWLINFCRSRNLKIDSVPRPRENEGLKLSDYIIRQKKELKKREEFVEKKEQELLKDALFLSKTRNRMKVFVKNFLESTYTRYLNYLPYEKLNKEYENKFNEVASYVLPLYEQDIVNNVKDYIILYQTKYKNNKIGILILNILQKVNKSGKIERKDALYLFNRKDSFSPYIKRRLDKKLDYYVNNTNDYFAYKSIIELNLVTKEILEKNKVEKKEQSYSM